MINQFNDDILNNLTELYRLVFYYVFLVLLNEFLVNRIIIITCCYFLIVFIGYGILIFDMINYMSLLFVNNALQHTNSQIKV